MTSPKDMREWERETAKAAASEKQPWPLALQIVIGLVGAYFMAQGIMTIKEGLAMCDSAATWQQAAPAWQQQQQPTWQSAPNSGYGPQQYAPPQQFSQQPYPGQYGPPPPAQHSSSPGPNGDGW